MYPLGGNDRRGDGPHPAAVCVGICALSATDRATAPCATRGSHAANHGGRDVARYALGTAVRDVTYRLASQSQDCVRPSRPHRKRNGRDPRRSREFGSGSDRATFMNAMSDRAARVRREALLHLLDDRALLERSLFDSNPGIRDLARFHLRGAQIDFAARYREAAADENVVAIDALGMTGDANDVELLRPFLTHKRTVIRRAAVKSIVRLGGARADGQRLEVACDRDAIEGCRSRRRTRTCEPSHCALEHELQPKPERAVARHRPRHALKVVRFATHAWA